MLWDAGRVRVSVQLVEAATARTCGRTATGATCRTSSRCSELARAIVGEIAVKATPAEQARLESAPAVKADAYELWLRGCEQQNQWTESGLLASVEALQRAIEKDPRWSPAPAALAESYLLLGTFGVRRPVDVASMCKDAANRALALDPALAGAHTTLGFAEAAFEWNGSAERRLRHAVTLNPGDARTHFYLGMLLLALGHSDDAVAEMRLALRLDPLSPNINSTLGWLLA